MHVVGNDGRKARRDRWQDQHGDNAVTLARDMAAELEASGISSGAALWRRVVITIESLQKTQPKSPSSSYRGIIT
jgi:hypothetical protein